MSLHVFRGVAPSADAGPPRYNVVSPPRKGCLDCTILGTDVLGIPTHWLRDETTGNERSHICAGDPLLCVHCGGSPVQPLYFVAGWDHALGAKFILRLGREGAKALEACCVRVGTVRGLRCEISDAIGRYGRQIVCVQARGEPLVPLCSPFPIEPVVAKLMKVVALPGWLTRREMESPLQERCDQ
jgi:hypothetical protein